MRFHVLACDYDGTLALDGHVDAATVAALKSLRASGRKLVLVTGRQLAELLTIFPEAELFERIVAENGALLYRPETGEEKLLAVSPPTELIVALRQRGVDPAIGHAIIATWRPHETTVFQVIRDLGLDWQVILNKDAVMALPANVNKGTGLKAVLAELGLSRHEAVGIGDAENDHALLGFCACGVAVANALPALKNRAEWVTAGDHGKGVIELIDKILADDLNCLAGRLKRHDLPIGHEADGAEATLPGYGVQVLIAGNAADRIVIANQLVDGFLAHHFQFCWIDPTGQFQPRNGAVTLGNSQRVPTVDEVIQSLISPAQNVGVNLLGLSRAQRAAFLLALLPRLCELHHNKSRPHWLVLDEADQLLIEGNKAEGSIVAGFSGIVTMTGSPRQLPRDVLNCLEWRLCTGPTPRESIMAICAVSGEDVPESAVNELDSGEVLSWKRSDRTTSRIRIAPVASELGESTRSGHAAENS